MKIARASDDDMRRMFALFAELEEELRDMRYGASVDSEKIGAIVKKHWGNHGPGVGGSWSRVLWGMDTLLRTCTDPEADTLEWRPDIEALDERQPARRRIRELEAKLEDARMAARWFSRFWKPPTRAHRDVFVRWPWLMDE